MFFSDKNNAFKIQSVLELKWKEKTTVVAPRNVHTLSLRLRGTASFTVDGRILHTHNNALVYVPRNCSYEIASKEEHLIVIHFKMSDKTPHPFEIFTPQNSIVFEDAFRTILRVWTNRKPGYYYRSMSILYKIFEEITKQFNPVYTKESYQKIKNSMIYLHANFTDPQLSIETLCRLSNLSDTQFRKIFYEFHKTTPLRYINLLRVNYAAELLSDSFFSVEEIAQMSGFTDSKYFSTVFKKHKNYSPSNYRKTIS